MAILIKNGTIVTSDSQFKGDIYVDSGIIKTIAKSIEATSDCNIIDAGGKYIFPGGIDPHVHLHLKTPAGYSSDDFLSGSKAALFGGTTSIIDFVTPDKGQSLLEALKLRKEEAANCLIDHSFHVSPIDYHENIEKEIEACISQGVTSFKVYLAYKKSIGISDDVLTKLMKVVANIGGIITLHCEQGDDVEKNRDDLYSSGKTGPEFHPLSRPNEYEATAVKTAIELANKTNCPIYIVHVSTKEALKHILKAQKEGQIVYAETCPQYLLLNEDLYAGSFEDIAPHIISPPYRSTQDNDALWKAISKGIIDTIGTDHCPFMMSQKEMGRNDFRKIPNGAGGIEHRLALLYTYGVLENRINLNQFVDLVATNPARIFGMYPKKGVIAEGSDADIIIWDPDYKSTISVDTHHQNCDSNIYEGIETIGKAETVIKSGEIQLMKRVFKNDTEVGTFIKRGL